VRAGSLLGVRIDVFTIFPEILEGPLRASLLGRAIEAGVVDVRVHDLRDFATGRSTTSRTAADRGWS
jgi:tRNA (guanine37-N1)-methyltransferase